MFDYLSAMTTMGRLRLRHSVPATASKYPLSTLFQSVTAAIQHHSFQQALHCYDPRHQTVEFRELSP